MIRPFVLSAMAAASLLGAQSSAHAAGVDPTIIPRNSQIGSLRIPLKCSFPIIGAQTLNIKLTGSMATNVTPGQPFYMTDGSGTLEMPQGLVDLAYSLLGVRQGAGSITELNFNLTNATPSVINGLAQPIIVPNLPVKSGQPLIMNLPNEGFMQVGPMVATNTPGQILVKMGTAKGVLKLLTSTGKTILWDLGVACKAPDPAIIVLGMTVAGTHTDEVSAPHSNIRTEDLDTPFMTQAGSLRFPLSCNIQGLGRREIDGTLTGIAPALYAPGEVFNAATNGYGNIVLTPDVVSELLGQVPAATKASVAVDQLEFLSTNTSPTSLTMASAAAPIVASDVPLTAGQRAVTRIPASGFLKIGTFKANSTGATETALYIGRTGATLALKNAAGQLLDTRRVDCDKPEPATTLVSVTIGGKAVLPSTVSGVSPASGTVAGGKSVYISGTNFTDARAVTFGGVDAVYKVVSSSLISATTPAHAAGAVTVTVQGVGGSTKSGSYTFK
jgi:hypothetical protein